MLPIKYTFLIIFMLWYLSKTWDLIKLRLFSRGSNVVLQTIILKDVDTSGVLNTPPCFYTKYFESCTNVDFLRIIFSHPYSAIWRVLSSDWLISFTLPYSRPVTFFLVYRGCSFIQNDARAPSSQCKKVYN